MIFCSFSYLLYFGAHFAKMEERKKILDALLISYSAYELSKSPVIIKKKRQRKVWVKQWLKRKEQSTYVTLINEFRLRDQEEFRKYLRMNTTTFEVSPYNSNLTFSTSCLNKINFQRTLQQNIVMFFFFF